MWVDENLTQEVSVFINFVARRSICSISHSIFRTPALIGLGCCILKRSIRVLQRSRAMKVFDPNIVRSHWIGYTHMILPSSTFRFPFREIRPKRSPRGQTSRVQLAGVWWTELARGAVVRLVRGGRWGLTARGWVGIERAARENPWRGLAAAKQQCVATLAATRLPINLFSPSGSLSSSW